MSLQQSGSIPPAEEEEEAAVTATSTSQATTAAGDESTISAASIEDEEELDIAPINLLPTECIVEIFSFLDGVSLCRASGVCRLWHRMSNLHSLWEAQCRTVWSVFNHGVYQHDWKAIYRDNNMQTKEGDFTFKMHKFLQLGPARICSPVFILADTRWHLRVHPRGNKDSGFVSIYLAATDYRPSTCKWEWGVCFSLTVVNETSELSICRQISNKAHPFCRDSEDWGWPCFIGLPLLTEGSGFLKNGTLEIRVSINILYTKEKNRKPPPPFVLAQVVTEDDFRAHHGFDLTSFDNVPEQQIQRNTHVEEFMMLLEEQRGIPKDRQRLWVMVTRRNQSVRPMDAINPTDVWDNVIHQQRIFLPSNRLRLFLDILAAPMPLLRDRVTICLFIKFYDPRELQLWYNTHYYQPYYNSTYYYPFALDSYLGKIFFPFEDVMANIFPILREMGGLAPDTHIVVHEEISRTPNYITSEQIDPNKSCFESELEDGDVLVFQTQESEGIECPWPRIPEFLEHILEEERWHRAQLRLTPVPRPAPTTTTTTTDGQPTPADTTLALYQAVPTATIAVVPTTTTTTTTTTMIALAPDATVARSSLTSSEGDSFASGTDESD